MECIRLIPDYLYSESRLSNAVLPYVYQGAVDRFHWLTAKQMIDRLALGETTPGPLIMAVAFVGYLAGHIQHLIGANKPFWFGVLGACIAT